MDQRKLMLFTGSSNPDLAAAISKELGTSLADAYIGNFSDGETRVKINEDVRGEDVFIVQSTSTPPNQHYMELFITIDALKRASAGRITAVMPYFGYARQDRKDQPRVPISAKLMANLLTSAGADRVMTIDLHAHQIQGFFDIPCDHLYAVNVFVDYFKAKMNNPVVVATDAGAVKMAHGYAKRLNCEMAVIDKRRVDDKNAVATNLLGDVEGKDALLVDDIIATGGSLVPASKMIKEHGANKIYGAITHGVLSGPAMERISESLIDEICITDTIAQSTAKEHKKIKVLSISPVLAEAIKRVHAAESISSLFNV